MSRLVNRVDAKNLLDYNKLVMDFLHKNSLVMKECNEESLKDELRCFHYLCMYIFHSLPSFQVQVRADLLYCVNICCKIEKYLSFIFTKICLYFFVSSSASMTAVGCFLPNTLVCKIQKFQYFSKLDN